MKTSELIGASPLLHARVAGLVGVVALVTGSFTGIVGSRLMVRDDVAATARNLLASQSLFRLGIVSSLLMMIAFLFYALLLYRLLKPVNRNHAAIMVALVVVSVPLYMLNQVNQFAALLLAPDQLYGQMKVFLELHRLGNLIAGIFFGLWLFPFGLLVFKSGFFPRFLGALLMIGSLGYLVLFVQAFCFPGSERTLWTNPFLLVTHVSEFAMMVWLLIKGLNVEQWERVARVSHVS
jgi:Domain of unknown function (DUF4386)